MLLMRWRSGALGLIDGAALSSPAVPAVEPAATRHGRRTGLDLQLGDRAVRVRCDDIVLSRVVDAAPIASHRE